MDNYSCLKKADVCAMKEDFYDYSCLEEMDEEEAAIFEA
jgi:hypothetical protein